MAQKNDGYDSDSILSQALDLYEQRHLDEEKLFITQNIFTPATENELSDISDILSLDKSIDVSDMFDLGGPSEVGGTCSQTVKEEPQRFVPVTGEKLSNMSMPAVPDNTMRKNKWAVNLYDKWRVQALQGNGGEAVTPEVMMTLDACPDIMSLSDEQLNDVLSVFIISLRKENGGEYTGSSIFSVVTALQRHLELNDRKLSFFSDPKFKTVKLCTDNVMRMKAKQGLGLNKKQAQIISVDQENVLWERGFLGDHDPNSLLMAVFWSIGINFGLRGGEEHRNLTMANFKLMTDKDGHEYLEYCESVSKTFHGGLKHRKIDPHTARAYAIPNSIRCPVYLFRKYISKLPQGLDASAFYFQPLTRINENIWFSKSPVGHNKLREFVKNLMSKAGFEGFYTNHSLRATTATRLFQNNVPEQLIMEQTGHRSSAIYNYKRPSDNMKGEISSVLQGSTSATTIVTSTGALPSTSSQHLPVFNVTNSELHFHFTN